MTAPITDERLAWVKAAIRGDEDWPRSIMAADVFALLSRLDKAEAGWQPIETAPGNDFHGKVIVFGGAWSEPTVVTNDGDWWRYRARESATGIPTHWRPVPPPPSSES